MNLTQILGRRRTSFSNCQDELRTCYTKSTFGGNLGFVDTEELLFLQVSFFSFPSFHCCCCWLFFLSLFLSAFTCHFPYSHSQPPFPPYLLSAGVIYLVQQHSLSYFFIASFLLDPWPTCSPSMPPLAHARNHSTLIPYSESSLHPCFKSSNIGYRNSSNPLAAKDYRITVAPN